MHYLTANENTGALTMTSREIAEVVGSRHDKVKQSIERLADRGVIQLPPVGEVKNRQGQTVFEYLVSKRDSYVVVAQLSPEFTAKLVDRWQELESSNIATLPDFTNPAIAARAWADEVEQKQAALLQETANRIRTSADSLEAVIAKDAKDSASHARQSFQKVGTC
jgi:phage regulator Rha-like protein